MEYKTWLIDNKTYIYYFTYSCKKDAQKAALRLKELYKEYKKKKNNPKKKNIGYKHIKIIETNNKFEVWGNRKK